MKNNVRKSFTTDTTWTAPAGVKQIKLKFLEEKFSFLIAGSSTPSVLYLSADNTMYGFGLNTTGNLGVGDFANKSSAVSVAGALRVLSLNASEYSAINFGIIKNNAGRHFAFGINTNGQLGVGDVTPRSSPVLLLAAHNFAKVFNENSSSGGGKAFGLRANGLAFGWGVNTNGQLGVGDVTPRSSPVAVLGGLTFKNIISASATLFLSEAGIAYACGANTNGQLGVGDVTPRSSPVAVLGGLTFKKIFHNGVSCYGITTAGVAYAWGFNSNGHLGVGDVTPRSSPVAVLGGLTVKDIFPQTSAANQFTFVLTESGQLYAMGENISGQLGVGDVTARSSPVAVLGGLTFKKVVQPLTTAAIGLTESGVAYAWGSNTQGVLGVGDSNARSSPVAVLGGLTFEDIFAGAGSAYGITKDGSIYAWGQNGTGQLGVGDLTSRSSPVAVLGPTVGMQKIFQELTFDVTPGTTYNIELTKMTNKFNGYVVGTGPLSEVVLEY